MGSVRQQLRTFVTENLLFGQHQQFSDDDSFFEQGIIDSTGVLELVTFLEQTFQIQISTDELIPENLDSISSLADFVGRKRRLLTEAIGLAG